MTFIGCQVTRPNFRFLVQTSPYQTHHPANSRIHRSSPTLGSTSCKRPAMAWIGDQWIEVCSPLMAAGPSATLVVSIRPSADHPIPCKLGLICKISSFILPYFTDIPSYITYHRLVIQKSPSTVHLSPSRRPHVDPQTQINRSAISLQGAKFLLSLASRTSSQRLPTYPHTPTTPAP